MANTSSRTLRLLSLLQTQRLWAGEELADRLAVSIRTLRRDIDRLRELGYPVQASRGVEGGYQLAPGAALPPLVLDDDEAVALAVGLQHAAQGGVDGIAEASVRALTKVVQVMPQRLRRQVEALLAATVRPDWSGAGPRLDPAVLVTAARACRDAERLRFDYRAADDTRSQREIEPLRLVPIGRRWYLVGYDLDRQGWRSFRVDRLSAPRPTGAPFRPRRLPAPDAATFVRDQLGIAQTVSSVTVVVFDDPDRVRRKIGRWATVEAHPDGALVQITGDSLDWPAMALGSLGAEFTVLSPPELRDQLAEWAARFGRAAADPGPAEQGPDGTAGATPS